MEGLKRKMAGFDWRGWEVGRLDGFEGEESGIVEDGGTCGKRREFTEGCHHVAVSRCLSHKKDLLHTSHGTPQGHQVSDMMVAARGWSK